MESRPLMQRLQNSHSLQLAYFSTGLYYTRPSTLANGSVLQSSGRRCYIYRGCEVNRPVPHEDIVSKFNAIGIVLTIAVLYIIRVYFLIKLPCKQKNKMVARRSFFY